MNEISIKLNIDGQEAVQVLKLTQAEYNKLYTKFESFQGFPPTALASMKALQQELLRTHNATEDTISATAEFIQYYGLTEKQIQELIRTLREEQKALSVTSAEYKTHSAAIANLNGAYDNIVTRQNTFQASSGKVIQGTSGMNMAMGQLGYMISDSSMFLVNFRMGLMSVANNFPMIIQYFQYATAEARALNMTIGQSLVHSLKGPGGLLLAVNAVMLIMQLMPAIFRETTKEVKKQADEIKKLKDEYAKLTQEQVKNYLVELNKQIGELEKKHPATKKYASVSTMIGGLGPSTPPDQKSYTVEDRFGGEAETYKDLQNRKKALEETSRDLGKIENIQNQITLNQEKLNKLNENPASPFYYKNIVKTANSYEEAKKTLEGWIAADEKTVKTRKEKEGDTYEEKLSKMWQYYEELTKYDKKYNDLYKAELEEQLKHYQDMISRKKNGIKDLKAEEIEAVNFITEKLTESRFAPRPDFSNLKPASNSYTNEFGIKTTSALDLRGMSGVPLTKEQDKENKDALKKEREILKLKSELFGESYNEEKQLIDDWYSYSMDRYQEDLNKHKTTAEEKELIEKLYHKKIDDLEQKTLENKIEGYKKTIDAANNLFSTIYNMASQSASDEIGEWKDKEEKKIEEEHKTALKHAKNERDKERIDAQYQSRKEKLEEEANEKAKEKLLVFFRLQQAANIASTIMSTYTAATAALKPAPEGLGPVFGIPLAALTVAGGLANVALIAQQKIPGYERGSMGLVGENGPEIIAPLREYASGQAELIMRTVAAVQMGMQDVSVMQGGSDPAFYAEIKKLNQNFERYANSPTPIYNTFDRKFAKQAARIGLGAMKRDKLV